MEKFNPTPEMPKWVQDRMEKTRIGEVLTASIARQKASGTDDRAPVEMRAMMVIALYTELDRFLSLFPNKLTQNTREHLILTLAHCDPAVMVDKDSEGKTPLDRMSVIMKADMKDWKKMEGDH